MVTVIDNFSAHRIGGKTA